jgi:hypothetical protein
MLARFQILLVSPLFIPADEKLEPYTFTYEGEHITVHPLKQAEDDSKDRSIYSENALITNQRGFIINEPPKESLVVHIIGSPERKTFQMNLLQLDFQRLAFDRRAIDDAVVARAFDIGNRILTTLRTSLKSPNIMTLSTDEATWRVEFLEDTGEPLLEGNKSFNRTQARMMTTFITRDIWDYSKTLIPTYETPNWNTLLLNASQALPEIGTAMVLTATALETLIEEVLEELALQKGIPKDLWSWIYNRSLHLLPEVEEEYDALLKIVSGKSLKTDKPQLWQAFRNIKNARNKFVHGGIARIGSDPVKFQTALKFIEQANEIADWIETLRPEKSHRPQIANEFTFTLTHHAPPTTNS